jgi:VIT1/CCC1 family predicted Fe2+/Mn2+ transporter
MLNDRSVVEFDLEHAIVSVVAGGFDAAATDRFAWSIVLSLAVLFTVGAARSRVGSGAWWANGLEMLGLGVIVGAVAYYAGGLVAGLVTGHV